MKYADAGRWRQALDTLLAGWLADAPDDVAGWTRRETSAALGMIIRTSMPRCGIFAAQQGMGVLWSWRQLL